MIELSDLQRRFLENTRDPAKARRTMVHCLDIAGLCMHSAAHSTIRRDRIVWLRNAARQMELAIVWRDRYRALVRWERQDANPDAARFAHLVYCNN